MSAVMGGSSPSSDDHVIEFVGQQVHGVAHGLGDVDALLPGGVAAAQQLDGAHDTRGVSRGHLHVAQVVAELPEAVVAPHVVDELGAEFDEGVGVGHDVGEYFGGDLRHVEFVFVFAGAAPQGGGVGEAVVLVAVEEEAGVLFALFLQPVGEVFGDEVGAARDDADGVVELVGDAGGELPEGGGHFLPLHEALRFLFLGGAVKNAFVALGQFVNEHGDELVLEGAVVLFVDGLLALVDVGEAAVLQRDDVVGEAVGAGEEALHADVAARAGAEDFMLAHGALGG